MMRKGTEEEFEIGICKRGMKRKKYEIPGWAFETQSAWVDGWQMK